MFSSKPKYLKLRTNLRLSINRFKLLEKKKTELAQKARKEIADYITLGKEDRARIRVEHIVREDYLVEAYEILELFADLLLARFGMIERMKEMDPGIEEAVASLIWATPRIQTDVPEMKEISKNLISKYGKEYGEMCWKDAGQTVNEKLKHKLSVTAPPKILIERYMEEIAKSYKVPFIPDPIFDVEEDPTEASDLVDLGFDNLDNRNNRGGGGGGGGMAGPMLPNAPPPLTIPPPAFQPSRPPSYSPMDPYPGFSNQTPPFPAYPPQPLPGAPSMGCSLPPHMMAPPVVPNPNQPGMAVGGSLPVDTIGGGHPDKNPLNSPGSNLPPGAQSPIPPKDGSTSDITHKKPVPAPRSQPGGKQSPIPPPDGSSKSNIKPVPRPRYQPGESAPSYDDVMAGTNQDPLLPSVPSDASAGSNTSQGIGSPIPPPGGPAVGYTTTPTGGLPSVPPGGLPTAPSIGLPSVPPGGLPSAPSSGLPTAPSSGPPTAPASGGFLDFPELPEVPAISPGSSFSNGPPGGDDMDFDDLTRRFEQLKKKR